MKTVEKRGLTGIEVRWEVCKLTNQCTIERKHSFQGQKTFREVESDSESVFYFFLKRENIKS